MSASTWRIAPLTDTFANKVRATMRSPGYGHPAYRDLATGYGPCRVCLRPFRTGEEERILFTYDPFYGYESEPLPGPVYIHAEACQPYSATEAFPDALRFIPMTLNVYGRGRHLLRRQHVTDGQIEPHLRQWLATPEVDYIHIRNTEAGCFIALALPDDSKDEGLAPDRRQQLSTR